MNTFDAYYAKQTPGNACRLAATDHRVQGMCNFDFVADLNKAGELADQHADMIAMLERVTEAYAETLKNNGYTWSDAVDSSRALLDKIKGE